MIKESNTQKKPFPLVDLNQTCPNLLWFDVPDSSSLQSHQKRGNFHSFCHQTYLQTIWGIYARNLIQNGLLFKTQSLSNFKLDQTKADTKNKHFTLVDLNQRCPNLFLFKVPGSGSLKLTAFALKSHQNRVNFHFFCHQTYQQIILRIHSRFLIQICPLFITQSLTNFKLDQTKAHTKNKHCTLVDLNQTCPNLLLFEVPGSGSLKLTESASKSHQQHSAAKPGRIKLSPTLSKLKKRRLVQSCVTPCISNTNQTNTKKIVKSQIVKK